MSNLDPPRDPLKVWIDYAARVRIGDNTIDPHYVLATLTKEQALELARLLCRALGVLTLAADADEPIRL